MAKGWARVALGAMAALAMLLSAQPAMASDDAPAAVPAGQPVHRIGIITYAGLGLEAIVKRELERLGYKEGVNVVYEAREGLRDMDTTRRQAQELVAWKPDLIISLMTNAHVAVQEATRETQTPVVFWSADPYETGIIRSYRKPGTNFTGFSYEPHAQEAELRLLKLAIPGLECVGHLYNHTYAPASGTLRNLVRAGQLMGVAVTLHEVLRDDEIEPQIAAIAAEGCGGFVVGPHEMLNRNGGLIGRLALKYHLAAVSIQTSVTEGGGLAAYSPPFERGWTAMAGVIDRILKGADPATIPVERGFKSPLLLNLKAARELGLALPPELIDEADEVIE